MDKSSYIGIRITLKEFKSLANGEINFIVRPKSKYWMYMLLEPSLENNNLLWKPKKCEYIITYTNIKRKKYNQKFVLGEIIDNGDDITVHIKEKVADGILSEVKIFGEKYGSLSDILNTNQETQITNLLKNISTN